MRPRRRGLFQPVDEFAAGAYLYLQGQVNMASLGRRPRGAVSALSARVEILAYAPTEFYHCQHCEVVWDQIGLGSRLRAEQRRSNLPVDLQKEYGAISDWVREVFDRYGDRLSVKVVDAASIEGVFKAIRHRSRRFPAFIIDGQERVVGFDRKRLDAALEQRLTARAARG